MAANTKATKEKALAYANNNHAWFQLISRVIYILIINAIRS